MPHFSPFYGLLSIFPNFMVYLAYFLNSKGTGLKKTVYACNCILKSHYE